MAQCVGVSIDLKVAGSSLQLILFCFYHTVRTLTSGRHKGNPKSIVYLLRVLTSAYQSTASKKELSYSWCEMKTPDFDCCPSLVSVSSPEAAILFVCANQKESGLWGRQRPNRNFEIGAAEHDWVQLRHFKPSEHAHFREPHSLLITEQEGTKL